MGEGSKAVAASNFDRMNDASRGSKKLIRDEVLVLDGVCGVRRYTWLIPSVDFVQHRKTFRMKAYPTF